MESSKPRPRRKRGGGRQARLAERAAPLAENLRPVRPGVSGGQYRPLTPDGVEQIHQAALQILDEVGLDLAPESGIKAMVDYGANYSEDDKRVRFSEAVVSKALKDANRSVTLFARDPQFDLNLEATRVHYGTAGAAVHKVREHFPIKLPADKIY